MVYFALCSIYTSIGFDIQTYIMRYTYDSYYLNHLIKVNRKYLYDYCFNSGDYISKYNFGFMYTNI